MLKGGYISVNSNAAPNGQNYLTNNALLLFGYQKVPTQGKPSESVINRYFYLPALGDWYEGKLEMLGTDGCYWASTAAPNSSVISGVSLRFSKSTVYVHDNSRTIAFNAWDFPRGL